MDSTRETIRSLSQHTRSHFGGPNEPLALPPKPYCKLCCNLSKAVADELPEYRPKREHYGNSYDRLDYTEDLVEELKSSHCGFCKFLVGVINTFVPDHIQKTCMTVYLHISSIDIINPYEPLRDPITIEYYRPAGKT